MDNLEQILHEAQAAFAATDNAAELEQVKARYLGKSGALTERLKGLGKMAPEERREAGARINQVKEQVEQALQARRDAIQQKELEKQLAQESLDVTLPGRGHGQGGLHPVTLTLERIERLFASIGFSVAEGPEIEDDFHNFTALNTPEDHPARSMHDTFYVEGGDLLRTHTSPVQVRTMLAHVARYAHLDRLPELKVIAPGRVYHVDSDATHSPMFHQVEGLWVG
ncbi:MAG: phenylalanine--tRNA ligase subunit alpha, partial [Sulfuricellaceae bacterium]